VLEGGYAIEGALPYVNAGIIMAMAGLDYSQLREPDYNPQQLRQTADITRSVKRSCDDVMTIWRKRHELTAKMRLLKNCNSRKRQIYYDTDNIFETQEETLRICDDCAGALRINSVSSPTQHMLGIHVPRKSCPACREQGLVWYEEGNARQFSHVFLQDRTTDQYLEKT
jgi:hypothetical protein